VTKGSHTTWSDWMPRTCEICGERITLKGKNALEHGGSVHRFDVATRTGRSWHADCSERERQRRRSEAGR
jgi:hypothetical protein